MSGYKTHRLSQEPDDYEGPWPEGDSMTEWVMVPREPTAEMMQAGCKSYWGCLPTAWQRRHDKEWAELWRAMLDAAPAAPQQAEPVAWMKFGGMTMHDAVKRIAPDLYPDFDIPLYTHPAPAAPQQAEPVAQIGWADEFGNLFPMGAWKPTQRTHHDSHKTVWRPVFLHPPAAEVQRLKQERDGLKNRLEWRHDGGPDGISARDETIKMQDAEVQRLARDFNRLKAAATAVTTALYDRERLFAVAELRAALAALEGGE
jgi:hypothetical protein